MNDLNGPETHREQVVDNWLPAPASDRRRMGVWENEGGQLSVPEAIAPVADGDGAEPRWAPAGRWSDLVEDRPVHLDRHGVPVLLVRSGDEAHALLDECSHGQVRLSDGDVADGAVECWLHGSCFDLVTGVPGGPPAIAPVPVFEVRVACGVVEVAIPRRP